MNEAAIRLTSPLKTDDGISISTDTGDLIRGSAREQSDDFDGLGLGEWVAGHGCQGDGSDPTGDDRCRMISTHRIPLF